MFQIKILGTAANWSRPFKSPKIKKFTSCYFKTDSCFQIDAGNKWDKRKIDYLLITHLHKDHIKKIKSYPQNIVFLIPDDSFKKVIPKGASINVLKRKNWFKKTKIEPFSVRHSQETLTFGFKISFQKHSFIWLPDFFAPNNYKDIKESDTWFIDGSSLKKDIHSRKGIKTHRAVSNFLQECKKRGIYPKTKRVYLIHLGLSMFPLKEKVNWLQKKFPDYIIKATKDGEEIDI